MPPLKKALASIGLGEKQILVLSTLLEHGPMLVASLARIAKLNRTTTYGLLNELLAKGLVSQIKKEGADRWQSITPELLPQYIEKRRQELADTKKEVENLLPQIKLLRAKGNVLPKVQFFEGKESVEQAYMDLIENNKDKHIYAFTGLKGVTENMDQKFVDYFIKTRMSVGIDAYYIVPKTDVGYQATKEDEKKMRYPRFIPPTYDFNGEINIYGNRVALFSYAQENPVGLIIEDQTLSHALKQIFDYVYSTAK